MFMNTGIIEVTTTAKLTDEKGMGMSAFCYSGGRVSVICEESGCIKPGFGGQEIESLGGTVEKNKEKNNWTYNTNQ